MRLFDDVVSRVDDPFLAHAAALAERARGAVAPNPLVGCVIAADGVVVGEGFHPQAGQPHAEVFALRDAGEAARGATAYVTLEPCSHHGRTPPCTEALVESGVARVVIGMRDPNGVAAGGARVLRDAGIAVEFAEDPEPFIAQNEAWLKRIASGLPWVTVKAGVSLDARVALAQGARSSMTGADGARVTRMCRSRADAVLVGASTLAIDDPALTVRDATGELAAKQPIRVVLTRTSLPDPGARVFTDGAAETLLLCDAGLSATAAGYGDGVTVVGYDVSEGFAAAFRAVAERGIGELFVEAGPALLTALWEERACDALVTVVAGGMAGTAAPALFNGGSDSARDALAPVVSPLEAGIVGSVMVTQWRPVDVAVQS